MGLGVKEELIFKLMNILSGGAYYLVCQYRGINSESRYGNVNQS